MFSRLFEFFTSLNLPELPDFSLSFLPLVLPLRMVIMQTLLLLLAIAVESTVFHWELRQPYRKSIEYAISLNLLCVVVGWLLFFMFERVLPIRTEGELIRYIFFDQWEVSTNLMIFVVGLVVFFFSVFLKVQALEWLEYVREEHDASLDAAAEELGRPAFSSSTGFSPSRRRSVSYSASNHRVRTILLANASSYSAIALILAARWVFYSFR